MVFESDSIPGAKVLVTGMWRDGAPVVAAIRPNVELKRFDVNLLASAYGKDRIEQLGKWNDAGLLRYFDKQKALAWATIGGVQFPWMVQLQQRLPINVIGPADVVKPSFKRGADGSAGVAELQEFADSLTAGWANAPEVVVLNSLDDANTPQAVLRENEAQKSKGANGKPRAFFYDGKVWLVNSQLNDKADAAEALFHEALGHYGLRGVFGKALGPVLNDLANRRPELMQAKAKEYGLNLGTVEGKLTAAEEVLAELAQTKPEISFIRMAVAAVRTWLRNNVEFFNNLKLTDDEIVRNFIVPARNWVETGKSKKPTIYRDDNRDVNNQDVRFSRGADKERASFKVSEGRATNSSNNLRPKLFCFNPRAPSEGRATCNCVILNSVTTGFNPRAPSEGRATGTKIINAAPMTRFNPRAPSEGRATNFGNSLAKTRDVSIHAHPVKGARRVWSSHCEDTKTVSNHAHPVKGARPIFCR